MNGLTSGEKYVVAVAAYTADGKLIGETIGESTRPILASHPMPMLMAWAYLAQVSSSKTPEIYCIVPDTVNTLKIEIIETMRN